MTINHKTRAQRLLTAFGFSFFLQFPLATTPQTEVLSATSNARPLPSPVNTSCQEGQQSYYLVPRNVCFSTQLSNWELPVSTFTPSYYSPVSGPVLPSSLIDNSSVQSSKPSTFAQSDKDQAPESPKPVPVVSANNQPAASVPPVPTPPSLPASEPKTYIAPEHLEPLFFSYAVAFNVDPNLLKHLANCESHYNPGANNGPYGGMFQYHASTWSSTRNVMGLDPDPNLRFDAEEAIKTTAFKISIGGLGAWANCTRTYFP